MPPRRETTSQPPAPGPPGPERPRFALAPALASEEVIDFATPNGAKLFKTGTDSLSTQFDCTAPNLQLFLDQLRDKVAIYDWKAIVEIRVEDQVKSIIDHYGELTYEQIKTAAEAYVHAETRMAQNSFMMYNCIMNTLTDGAQKQVRVRGLNTPFTVNGRGSGAMLLKVVIMVSHVDTRATITAVQLRLSSLDVLMRELDSNVEKFNDKVNSLVAQLHARGEQMRERELFVNLLKGYKACKDQEFVDYIRHKEYTYEEGGAITHNQMMEWAVNMYKARMEAGTWCQKVQESEDIIALQARLSSIDNRTKGLESRMHKPKQSDTKHPGQKTKKGKKKAGKPKEAWRLVPPKEGDPKSRKVGEKTYHWCHNHQAWVIHKPSDCRGIATPGGGEKSGGNGGTKGKGQLKLAKALAAIQMSDEDE